MGGCVAKADREKEEEFLLCSLLKKNLECVGVSYDNSSPMELLLGQDQRDCIQGESCSMLLSLTSKPRQ